ncbi:MAG: DUF389 domain-containing protein, partial [Leptolyngbyaceae bacterium]|nr:DUF389 domain-containing protein [Leptolyngbyaceae bacterium]
AVTIAISALLSWIFSQQVPTDLMVDRSQISAVTVLLPLAAGAAGALNLIQSERSSLVSGAATGMLVAASLAPPAGIIGMAGAIGRWDLTVSGLFLLLLQLVGINLSASLLFRGIGLSTQGARYQRGQKRIFPIAWWFSALAIASLLIWQLTNPPNLERSSLAQRANAVVQQIIQQNQSVNLVEANVRFTRSNTPNQNTLLSVIYVERKPNTTQSANEIRRQLTQRIQQSLLNQGFNATPLVDVNVLEAPAIQS